ncbi:hypothetical protein, partial [uncultured Fusobacterium sp.]|uniref:hypothetical protein n=1 Tax=uncultured Fusobacterium sp. TaxID=159267 RepID=UPI0025CF7B3A
FYWKFMLQLLGILLYTKHTKMESLILKEKAAFGKLPLKFNIDDFSSIISLTLRSLRYLL